MATVNLGQVRDKITSISRTSGTGAAGTTDTYTIYTECSPGGAGTFNVYNGANGTNGQDGKALYNHQISNGMGAFINVVSWINTPCESLHDAFLLIRNYSVIVKNPMVDANEFHPIVEAVYDSAQDTMTLYHVRLNAFVSGTFTQFGGDTVTLL